MDKVSDLPLDRIFSLLGRGKLPLSPEKIIIYGLFFIGIVIFVNWLLSVTVIVLKPFLYAALMLAVIRPDFIKYMTTEEAILRFTDSARKIIGSFALGVMDMLQLFIEQFNRS